MKLTIKIGDKVKVLRGESAGKEAVVQFVDKRSNRVRLEGLKQVKASKKGSGKDLHGTFHVRTLAVVKQEPTQTETSEAATAPEASA